MTSMWITVPNWDRFQHYKDRVPPWIKLYTAELLHDTAWEGLSAGSRGTLVTIWAEYALHKGQLSTEVVSKSLGRSYKAAYLDSLNDAGFIELSASKPLPLARARSREVEVLESKKKTRTRANKELARVFEEEEPPRDPEALTKIRRLADEIGRTL